MKEALDLKVDPEAQNKMMDVRWVYFVVSRSFEGASRKAVKACPTCFAKWVTALDVTSVEFF